MPLKTKLTWGLIILFLFILALGTVGIYSIHRLAADSEAVLRDNQNSVLYCGAMLQSLDDRDWPAFDSALARQEHNITEPGEGPLTRAVRHAFDSLRAETADGAAPRIRALLYRISAINEYPIQRKSSVAAGTARKAITGMTLLVVVLTLTALAFVINFPGAVSRPVQEQNEAKTNFIATISHELKTPISSIKMAGQLLQD